MLSTKTNKAWETLLSDKSLITKLFVCLFSTFIEPCLIHKADESKCSSLLCWHFLFTQCRWNLSENILWWSPWRCFPLIQEARATNNSVAPERYNYLKPPNSQNWWSFLDERSNVFNKLKQTTVAKIQQPDLNCLSLIKAKQPRYI